MIDTILNSPSIACGLIEKQTAEAKALRFHLLKGSQSLLATRVSMTCRTRRRVRLSSDFLLTCFQVYLKLELALSRCGPHFQLAAIAHCIELLDWTER